MYYHPNTKNAQPSQVRVVQLICCSSLWSIRLRWMHLFLEMTTAQWRIWYTKNVMKQTKRARIACKFYLPRSLWMHTSTRRVMTQWCIGSVMFVMSRATRQTVLRRLSVALDINADEMLSINTAWSTAKGEIRYKYASNVENFAYVTHAKNVKILINSIKRISKEQSVWKQNACAWNAKQSVVHHETAQYMSVKDHGPTILTKQGI